MPQDTQPEFEWPARMRLPQVPPLKVPARRQTQFMARPDPVRYTEQVPVTPPLAPENDLFMPVPVTPPLTHQPQRWIGAPDPLNHNDISVTILPDEKLDTSRDAMNRVRSVQAQVWSGRDESRPYRLPQGLGLGVTSVHVTKYIPTARRSRDVGNGEFLLGCAFLIFMALLALGLLTWLSSAR